MLTQKKRSSAQPDQAKQELKKLRAVLKKKITLLDSSDDEEETDSMRETEAVMEGTELSSTEFVKVI